MSSGDLPSGLHTYMAGILNTGQSAQPKEHMHATTNKEAINLKKNKGYNGGLWREEKEWENDDVIIL